MTSTARLLANLAYNRDEFVNRTESQLIRAMHLFYEARLAKKNGKLKHLLFYVGKPDAAHILDTALASELRHPIRGFTGRRKVFAQATRETKSVEPRIRRGVEAAFLRDYGMDALHAKINACDAADFWALVDVYVQPVLASIEKRQSRRASIAQTGR
jgi:hypothetical protein